MFGSYSSHLTKLDRLSSVTFNSLLDKLRHALNASICTIVSENEQEPGEEIETEYFVIKPSQLYKSALSLSSETKKETKEEKAEASETPETAEESFVFIEKEEEAKEEVETPEAAESFALIEKTEKEFYVFQVAIDQTQDVTPGPFRLPSLTGLVKSVCKKNPESTAVLLIPLYQCGGYLGANPKNLPFLQRHHIVLAEIDLGTKNYRIHDSQSRISSALYLGQCAGSELGPTINPSSYHSYGMQKDNISCGYNVFEYIIWTLYAGETGELGKVIIDPALIKSRQNFLDDWRKITEKMLLEIVETKEKEVEEDALYVNIVGIPGLSSG